jgi:hypothetical protein
VFVPGEPGAQHLQVHPGAAAPDPEREAAVGEVVEQRDLLGKRHRVRGRQHADGRAQPDARRRPERVCGERDRGRAGAVGHEVVLGDPRVVEARRLGAHHRVPRPPQRGTVVLAGKSARQQEDPEPQADGHPAFAGTGGRGTKPGST